MINTTFASSSRDKDVARVPNVQLIWQYFDLSFFNDFGNKPEDIPYQIMRWWIRDTGWQIHNSGSSFQVTNLICKGTHDFSPWKGARFFSPKMLTRKHLGPSYFLYWYLHLPRRCWVLNGWYDDKGPYTTSVWVEKKQFFARCHQVSLQYQLPITSYITIYHHFPLNL